MENELSKDRENLKALIKVCTSVNRYFDLDDVLKAIMSVTTDIMKVETSSLALEDEETGGLVFHTTCGEGAGRIEHIRMKRGEGIVGWVAQTGNSAIVNDAENDERFCKRVDNESGFVTQSILCVPLQTPKRILGAIEVINALDNRNFTEADQELCKAIAGQAAIAIENALLHNNIVQHERMAAIGQTITSLGHCIKNVLHGIGGGAYMVDTGIKKDDMTSLKRGWGIVKKNNAFMQDLVLDMLNYSKEREPDFQICNMNGLIESVCEIVAEKAALKGVKVTWNVNSDLDSVVVDPMGIKRCVLNLVSNGIDACEDAVEEKAVVVSLRKCDNDSFVIIISDTGCGIPENARKNMFKMFFSTKGNKGTGLGLAVTKKIIKEHGGDIELDSESKKGTTFLITLPFKESMDIITKTS